MSPGWVVSYIAPSKGYGTAFHVSLWGQIRARGIPRIVTNSNAERQRTGDAVLEQFRNAFARADAATEVGQKFSGALPVLGDPVMIETNTHGAIEARFIYMPNTPPGYTVDFLTNGLWLRVTDDIITAKSYSYTSSP